MRVRTVIGIVAALATAGGAVLAQAPGGQRPFGGGGGFGGGAFGGVMGGFVMGTIRQVDHEKNAIQVQPMGPEGAQGRWITFAPDAAVYAQGSGTLAELKVNDTIVVSGVPTAITAAQIQIGEVPPLMLRGGPGGPAGFRGPEGVPPPGGAPGAPNNSTRPPTPGTVPPPAGAPPAGFGAPGGQLPFGQMLARATGTVVSTRPLVVMLPGSLRLNVDAPASTRVTKISRIAVTDLKVGDTIRATGQPREDGSLVASRVDAGMDMVAGFPGGFGFGGFGPVAPGAGFGAPVVPIRPNQPGNF